MPEKVVLGMDQFDGSGPQPHVDRIPAEATENKSCLSRRMASALACNSGGGSLALNAN